MSLFFRKSLLESGIFHNFVDYHSHILPGVDDGIRTMEESLDTLKYFESLGVVTVWCTPHIMEDMPNDVRNLQSRFEALKDAYTGPIALRLSAENMIDRLFEDRLDAGDVLPFGEDANQLLVETSYFNSPARMDDIIEKIFAKGYYPVLAHPERYRYMDKEKYRKLVARGVRLQLNLLSLGGCFGSDAKSKAEWLYRHHLCSYFGTDIHSLAVFQERVKCKTISL